MVGSDNILISVVESTGVVPPAGAIIPTGVAEQSMDIRIPAVVLPPVDSVPADTFHSEMTWTVSVNPIGDASPAGPAESAGSLSHSVGNVLFVMGTLLSKFQPLNHPHSPVDTPSVQSVLQAPSGGGSPEQTGRHHN